MKKGFTLIELLAVIVILAVIALIAVPVVLHIVSDTKETSDERSIKLYLDTIEKNVVRKNLTKKFNPEVCDINEDGNLNCDGAEIEVEMKGSRPSEGTLHFRNGKIILGENILFNNKYYQVDIEGNVILIGVNKKIEIAYFKEYDGSNNFLGFDKTNITSFSRNTALTKEQVLNKEGVQLISNTEEDNYKSEHEVYGWIEDNNFYWWSEADMVYFHPKTKTAFKEMTNLVTVDLNGVSTSKVENFYAWFYSDANLNTINGKINTSGLKIQSGNAISFCNMFYGCSKLKSIDTSEFYTENAISMQNMFSGCSQLKKLDLSSFNTSNVTNMSYMFYFCSNLVDLNVSSFDTNNVVNMRGMFYGTLVLSSLDVTNFNTKNVSNMNGMFNVSASVIVLGENFDTRKVSNMEGMFSSNSLKVIYSKNDFVIKENAKTTNMLKSSKNTLIGGYGTAYQTPYDSNYMDSTYAKISNANQSGYFTYYESINDIKFNITYELNGGVASNPNSYVKGINYTLSKPQKEGYTFIGWTGSNGNTPQVNVKLDASFTGNKHYIANYTKN